MTQDDVARWALTHPLAPIHVDCATAVMLKILDGKCKMRIEEKRVMELLYDEVKTQPGRLLDTALHLLIAQAREHPDEATKNIVYEKRLLAETAISRLVMIGESLFLRKLLWASQPNKRQKLRDRSCLRRPQPSCFFRWIPNKGYPTSFSQ